MMNNSKLTSMPESYNITPYLGENSASNRIEVSISCPGLTSLVADTSASGL